MIVNYCCQSFKEAYESYVIHNETDNPSKFFLYDSDCCVIEVEEPIKFCPYCGFKLNEI